jgi:hypothetical protein
MKNSEQKMDGTMIMVDVTGPGSMFPDIILFFVGEISGQTGILPFKITDILMNNFEKFSFESVSHLE